MAQLCRTVPRIYDAQNQLVGVASPQQGLPFIPPPFSFVGGTGPFGVVMRKIGNVWYQLAFTNEGPFGTVPLYFEGANCTGQPLFGVTSSAFLPQVATCDGAAFWVAAGTPEHITSQSFFYEGSCHSGEIGGGAPFSPAVKLDVPPFNPPFAMR